MYFSYSVISKNHFFKLGFSNLLKGELLRENFYIIDTENTDYSLIHKYSLHGKNIFAFISSDLDYYAFNSLNNMIFIDKKSCIEDVMNCILADNSQFNYIVKKKFSKRQNEAMRCIVEGLTITESVKRLKITVKAFYSVRRQLIIKLQLENRISFYRDIAKYKSDYYCNNDFYEHNSIEN